ncbi:MAG: glycosyltransferase family 39 protein [Myxococcales bacterium]|nr:glycosyltransferase family 39 protein [Myxococcales bacterium]
MSPLARHPPIERRRRLLAAGALFAFFVGLYLLTSPFRFEGVDGGLRYAVTRSLLERGELHVDTLRLVSLAPHVMVWGEGAFIWEVARSSPALPLQPLIEADYSSLLGYMKLYSRVVVRGGRRVRRPYTVTPLSIWGDDWRELHPDGTRVGRGFRVFANYPVGHSLLMVPFAAIGGERLASAAVPVCAAFAPLLIFLLLLELGYSLRRAVAVASIVGAASIVWPYATSTHDAALSTLWVFLALFGLVKGARGRWAPLLLAGAGIGLALLTKQSNLVLLPAALVFLAVAGWDASRPPNEQSAPSPRDLPPAGDTASSRETVASAQPQDAYGARRFPWAAVARWWFARSVVLLAGFAPFAAFDRWYWWYRFAGVHTRGSATALLPNVPRTTVTELVNRVAGIHLEGFYGFLVSPSKSVFLFTPPLLLSVALFGRFVRRQHATGAAILVFVLSSYAGHAALFHWGGDYSWGPRYLVAASAVALLPLAEWPSRRWFHAIAAVVIGFSLLVQLSATLVENDRYYSARRLEQGWHYDADKRREIYFSWRYFRITDQIADAWELGGRTIRALERIGRLPEGRAPNPSVFHRRPPRLRDRTDWLLATRTWWNLWNVWYPLAIYKRWAAPALLDLLLGLNLAWIFAAGLGLITLLRRRGASTG